VARAGRAYPNRPRLARHPRNWDRAVALDTFETFSEWPTLDVHTPNVDLPLDAFETFSEWPTITLDLDQNLSLPTFETLSEWPELAVTVPVKPGDALTGADGEVEWNGTLWGPATSVRVLLPIEGWLGTPSVDNTNVDRPGRHGAWNARKLAKQRIVTIKLQPNSADDPTQIHELLDEIIAATGLPESEEPLPLVIKGYGTPKLAYGQVIDRPITLDGDYNAGLPTVGLLIACGDPRLYDLEPRGATVPTGVPTGLLNSGNAATNPVIRLEGPLTNPVLANQTLDRTLQFTITLAAGDVLEIDTDNGTVVVDDVNRLSTLGGSSVPIQDFVLAAGENTISYTALTGGGNGADFLWKSATL
jgi:phage-related protein